jgi:hypothetical protein
VISVRSHNSSWDFKTLYTRTLIYSLVSNEASYLKHFVPKFSIYSVKRDLHDRKVCYVHLCYGLTRIDLSSLENFRNIWVVITGLELLSLACPCLGLGRDYVHHLYLCDPIKVSQVSNTSLNPYKYLPTDGIQDTTLSL